VRDRLDPQVFDVARERSGLVPQPLDHLVDPSADDFRVVRENRRRPPPVIHQM
jgi:hypothetical protein